MISFERDKEGKLWVRDGFCVSRIYTYGDYIIEKTQKEQEEGEKAEREKEKENKPASNGDNC